MNLKQAREIIDYGQNPAYAKGYLECYEQMKPLVKTFAQFRKEQGE